MNTPIPELEMNLVGALPGFLCKRCARCCMDKVVVVYPSDLKRLKGLKKQDFVERTTNLEKGATGATYKMKMVEGKCIFLEGKSCKYYELRPNTCRRHPFLVTDSNLLVAAMCPGADWSASQNSSEYRVPSKDIAKRIDRFLKSL